MIFDAKYVYGQTHFWGKLRPISVSNREQTTASSGIQDGTKHVRNGANVEANKLRTFVKYTVRIVRKHSIAKLSIATESKA